MFGDQIGRKICTDAKISFQCCGCSVAAKRKSPANSWCSDSFDVLAKSERCFSDRVSELIDEWIIQTEFTGSQRFLLLVHKKLQVETH